MFKADPLSPFTHYMSTYFLSGMGLFVEGFTLFSIGNLTPLFKVSFSVARKTRRSVAMGLTGGSKAAQGNRNWMGGRKEMETEKESGKIIISI